MGPRYVLADLYVPLSEAAGLLGVTKARLRDYIHSGFINISIGHVEIYGPAFHMSEILRCITCSSLATEGLSFDLSEQILTTLEVEGGRTIDGQYGDCYIGCINYALQCGLTPIANALNEAGVQLDSTRLQRLHRQLKRKFRRVVTKLLWDDSYTNFRVMIASHVPQEDRVQGPSLKRSVVCNGVDHETDQMAFLESYPR